MEFYGIVTHQEDFARFWAIFYFSPRKPLDHRKPKEALYLLLKYGAIVFL